MTVFMHNSMVGEVKELIQESQEDKARKLGVIKLVDGFRLLSLLVEAKVSLSSC